MELVAVDYTSPTAKQDFVRSLRDTGFGVLKNHPLRQEEVQALYDDWRQFFGEDRKNDFAVPHNGAGGFYPQSWTSWTSIDIVWTKRSNRTTRSSWYSRSYGSTRRTR